jgi:hypothetical protein
VVTVVVVYRSIEDPFEYSGNTTTDNINTYQIGKKPITGSSLEWLVSKIPLYALVFKFCAIPACVSTQDSNQLLLNSLYQTSCPNKRGIYPSV